MSGRASRQKGLRGEYGLRDYLRKQGYKADRVPSSGAAQGFPGDIRAVKDGKETLFEMKLRKASFKSFYELISVLKSQGTDRLGVTVPGLTKQCVDISGSLGGVYDTDGIYELVEKHPLYERFKRLFKRLNTLEKLIGKADILVLRDDRQPFVFLRFR